MTITKTLALHASGLEVSALHKQLIQAGFTIPAWELNGRIFGKGTQAALKTFQKQIGASATGVVDEATKKGLRAGKVTGVQATQASIGGATASAETGAETGTVDGRLFFQDGLNPSGVTVRAYNRVVGSRDVLLAEGTTDAHGRYRLSYELPAGNLNLEIRVVTAKGSETPISTIKRNASAASTMNLLVPASVQRPASEYNRLMEALKEQGITSVAKLAKVQETNAVRDLTLLHSTTGWDARLIALAAIAAQKYTQFQLRHDVLYALLRVGLPHDENLLAAVDVEAVEEALKKAKTAGIIDLSDGLIASAVSGFETFAFTVGVNALSGGKAAGTVSTFGEMVEKSGLTTNQQAAFTSTYFEYLYSDEEDKDLWEMLAALVDNGQAIFGAADISKLKLQAKLGHLTLSNASLVESVMGVIQPTDHLSALVDQDFHKAETWEASLNTIAGGDNNVLASIIPSVYTAETVEERRSAYCEDLASHVATSFPTRAVAQQIGAQAGQINLGASLNDPVKNFLLGVTGESGSFELGTSRIVDTLFLEVPEPDRDAVADAVKRLQRLFKISPSDNALTTLHTLGISSAHEIAALPRDRFLSDLAPSFVNQEEALAVYNAARQVDAVAKIIGVSALKMGNQAVPYVMQDPGFEAIRADVLSKVPDVGSLIGAADFCNCEHCRSVLSPAAYFVDVLNMLDSNPQPPANSPFYYLVQRRPDLPNLPLTCENTNTAMPYIDIVNEILEYITANDSLEAAAALDTGDASTEDLLAEPQNTNVAAYEVLNGAKSRVGLPFDLPTEMLRRFGNRFDTPLWKLMDVFRPSDKLEPLLVRVASTENVDIASAPDAIDSIVLQTADRVLLKNQTDATQNGVYVFMGETLAMTRATEADSPEELVGLWVAVEAGSEQGNWWGVENRVITLGEHDVSFVRGHNRTSVFMEFLGLSPADVHMFSANYFHSQINPWGALYGYEDNSAAYDDLTSSAKTIADRLGISYVDLAAVIDTSFVNPYRANLSAIEVLNRDPNATQQVDLAQARVYVAELLDTQNPNSPEADEFNAGLGALTTTWGGFTAQEWLNQFGSILFLNPDSNKPCDFGLTKLHYLEGTPSGSQTDASDIDFLKINLFVRLWKKLGWSIEETDRALTTLLPSNVSLDSMGNIGEAFGTALVYLAHFKELLGRLRIKKNSILKLTTFWSDVATRGHTRLYRELFNLPVIANPDNVFDSPLGIYLQRSTPSYLKDYLLDLQGALGLTGEEIVRILTDDDPEVDIDTVELTLANVSLICRYSLLARGLGMSVKDMITLVQLSGLSPFEPLEINALTNIELDHPFVQTIRFVEIAEQIKESPFDVEDLDHLVRHQFDPVGKYRGEADAANEFLTGLRGELGKIRSLYTLPDASGLTNDYFMKRLELAFPADVIQRFMMFWAGVSQYQASAIVPHDAAIDITGDPDYSQLDEADFENEADVKIEWNASEEIQRLVFYGIPTPTRLAELTALAGTQNEINLLTDLWGNLQPLYLDSADFVNEPDIDVEWDGDGKIQHIRYRGALTDSKKTSLVNLVTTQERQDLLAGLLEDIQNQSKSFPLDKWARSLLYEVEAESIVESDHVDPDEFEDLPYIELSWDSNTEVQKLVYHGVLSDEQITKLANRLAGNPQTVLSNLLAAVQELHKGEFEEFYERYLVVSFLGKAKFDELFEPGINGASFAITGFSETARRSALLTELFNALRPKQIRQAVIDYLAKYFGADADVIEVFADETKIPRTPPDNDISLLEAFADVGGQGVSAVYEYDVNKTLKKSQTAVSTAEKPDDSTFKATYDGYLQVREAGEYRFQAAPDVGTAVSLTIEGSGEPQAQTADGSTSEQIDLAVVLDAGVPYHFVFEAVPSGGSTIGLVELLVVGEKFPLGATSQLTLYPSYAGVDSSTGFTLLSKLLHIVERSGIGPAEYQYFVKNQGDFDDFDPNLLATQATTESSALFDQLLRLDAYRKLKLDLGGETEDLIEIFAKARTVNDEDTVWSELSALIANATRRDPGAGIIEKAVESLGFVPAKRAAPWLVNEQGLGQLWEALQAAEKFGVPADQLSAWVAPAEDFAGAFKNAQSMRGAIKARFAPEEWRLIAQPIFDELRRLQRDALVARILHEKDLETVEKLYEDLLIDPGMEPIVQTSRLRLAISSVQLFVHRCLLGLEPSVSLTPEIRERWEWMKRYRVWEANRKIFLYPENWLEPEFRDDKSHIYQELESTLLGGEVTSEKAEEAFASYLSGLEEVARLEIMALCCEEKNPSYPEQNVLHIVGRTYAKPQDYFYRRYADGMWTPWVPVDADIDSDHLACAMWHGKFHLFWVTVAAESENESTSDKPRVVDSFHPSSPPSEPRAKLTYDLSWCEYSNGEWTDQTVGGEKRAITIVGTSALALYPYQNLFKLRVTVEKNGDGSDGAIQINLVGPIKGFFRLNSKNDGLIAVPPGKNPSLDVPRTVLDSYDPYKRVNGRFHGTLAVADPNDESIQDDKSRVYHTLLSNCAVDDNRGIQPIAVSSNLAAHPNPFLGKFLTPFFFQDKQNTLLGVPRLRRTLFKDQDDPVSTHTRTYRGSGPEEKPDPIPFSNGEGIGFVDVGRVGLIEMEHNWEVDLLEETTKAGIDFFRGAFGLGTGGDYTNLDFVGRPDTRVLYGNVLVGATGADEHLQWVRSTDAMNFADSLVHTGELADVPQALQGQRIAGRIYAKAGTIDGTVTVLGAAGRFSWQSIQGPTETDF